MSTPIITVENLGKTYRLEHQGQKRRYTALRDVIAETAKLLIRAPFSRNGSRKPSARTEEFWALKDVSFEVKQGEVVGIIGRNGAGKSTLLKILSRITEPTTGRVRLRGRVASLLEVGTGFHPELTGRENIYLNGAILGMPRTEIRRKFDEIVAFAEVEKFLDTPVKRYSSGMYVRLAFAVAAHLEPEILVVDEVLAVGDADFQKKCLGKMEDVSKGGRTVLFVSHNMATIQALCPKAILLQSGSLLQIGTTSAVSAAYLQGSEQTDSLVRPRRPDGEPSITRLQLTDIECDEHTVVHFRVEIYGRSRTRCSLEVKAFDALGIPIGFGSVGLLDPSNALDLVDGREELRCELRLPRMARGVYRLSVQVAIPMVEVLDSVGDGLLFELHPRPRSAHGRVLESNWGYGPFELPLRVHREHRERPDPVGLSLQQPREDNSSMHSVRR
jgi:lipopolysaccharide transport system ATP-binding protein